MWLVRRAGCSSGSIYTVQSHATELGHTKLIFCSLDSAGLFLADLKKILINIPHVMIVTGQEYSLKRALLVYY